MVTGECGWKVRVVDLDVRIQVTVLCKTLTATCMWAGEHWWGGGVECLDVGGEAASL